MKKSLMMMFSSPSLTLLIIGLLASSNLLSYYKGYEQHRDSQAHKLVQLEKKYSKALRLEQNRAFTASTALEIEKKKEKVFYKTIHKEIIKYENSNAVNRTCLNSEQLRIVNATISGSGKAFDHSPKSKNTLPKRSTPIKARHRLKYSDTDIIKQWHDGTSNQAPVTISMVRQKQKSFDRAFGGKGLLA